MKMFIVLTVVYFILQFSSSSSVGEIRIAQCLHNIPDETTRLIQTKSLGPFNQFTFDDTAVLHIRGSGFRHLNEKNMRLQLSGDAVQRRDFSVEILSENDILITLKSGKRWLYGFPSEPFQPIYLMGIAANGYSHELSRITPIVIANIARRPMIMLNNQVIFASDPIIIRGAYLFGHEITGIQLNQESLKLGIDFFIESEQPLHDNQITLKLLTGKPGWRSESGVVVVHALLLNHFDEWVQLNNADGIVVATVQCGLLHNTDFSKITSFGDSDDLSMYDDQLFLTIDAHGVGLMPPLYFANDLQMHKHYSIISSQEGKIVLKLISGKKWTGNVVPSLPQSLILLSAADSSGTTVFAVGQNGTGIVVSVIYQRPIIYESRENLHSGYASVLYIHGSGFVKDGATLLAFEPPIRQNQFTTHVLSSSLLEVALHPGGRWEGENKGIGSIRVKGISTRGDSGWTKLSSSMSSSLLRASLSNNNGVIVANIVPQNSPVIVHSSVVWTVFNNNNNNNKWPLNDFLPKTLPVVDPFRWWNLYLPEYFTYCTSFALAIVETNAVVVSCLSENNPGLNGIYRGPLRRIRNDVDESIEDGPASDVDGNHVGYWHKLYSFPDVYKHYDATKYPMVNKIVSVSNGKVIIIMLSHNVYLSFSYGLHWKPAFEQQVENYVFAEVASSQNGNLLALIMSNSVHNSHHSRGGELFFSFDYGEHWKRISVPIMLPVVHNLQVTTPTMSRRLKFFSLAIGGTSGEYVVASVGPGLIARSSTRGETWTFTQNAAAFTDQEFVCSQLLLSIQIKESANSFFSDLINAQNQNSLLSSIAVTCLDVSGSIFVSKNFAVHWARGGSIIDAPANEDFRWDVLVSDMNGKSIVGKKITEGIIPGCNLYLSLDSGLTFSLLQHPTMPIGTMFGISPLGNIIVAGIRVHLYIGSVTDEIEKGRDTDDEVYALARISVLQNSLLTLPIPRKSEQHRHNNNGETLLSSESNAVDTFNVVDHSIVSHEKYAYLPPTLVAPYARYDWLVDVNNFKCSSAGSLAVSLISRHIACVNETEHISLSSTFGRSWKLIRLSSGDIGFPQYMQFIVSMILISPSVWVSCMRSREAYDRHCSIYRSVDNGKNWMITNASVGENFSGKLSHSGQFQAIVSIEEYVRNAWRDTKNSKILSRHISGDMMPSTFDSEIISNESIWPESSGEIINQYTQQTGILTSNIPPRIWNRGSAYRFHIKISSDFGLSWHDQPFLFPDAEYSLTFRQIKGISIAIADIGSWVYIAIPLVGIVMTSNLGVDGWFQTSAMALNWRDIACSENGQYVVAGYAPYRIAGIAPNTASGGIYYSNTFGMTWIRAESPTMWAERVTVSRLGSVMACIVLSCQNTDCNFHGDNNFERAVYISTDSGREWIRQQLPLHSIDFPRDVILAATPDGDKIAVVGKDGTLYIGEGKIDSVDGSKHTEFSINTFHYSVYASFEEPQIFSISGAELEGEIKLDIEPIFFECGYDAKVEIKSVTMAQLVISRNNQPSNKNALEVDRKCLIDYRVLSTTVIRPGRGTQIFQYDKDTPHVITVLRQPVVFPDNDSILYETSIRSLRIFGSGFQGPFCLLYLLPTPLGTYTCKIISTHELELNLKDDADGYSGSWGWVDFDHHWDNYTNSIPLKIISMNFGVGNIPVHVTIANVCPDRRNGVATLKLNTALYSLPWKNFYFITTGITYLTDAGIGKIKYPYPINANMSNVIVHIPYDASTCTSFAAGVDGNLAYQICGSRIFRSYNSGRSWSMVKEANFTWSSIACNSNGKFATASSDAGTLYWTSSFGSNWIESTVALPPSYMTSQTIIKFNSLFLAGDGLVGICILSSNNSMVSQSNHRIDDDGLVLLSTTGGKQWKYVELPNKLPLLASVIFCSGLCDVIVVLQKAVEITPTGERFASINFLKSINHGLHWQQISSLRLASVQNIAMYPENDEVVVVSGIDFLGDSALLISYSGGKSWSRFEIPWPNKLVFDKLLISSQNSSFLAMAREGPESLPRLLSGTIINSLYLRVNAN